MNVMQLARELVKASPELKPQIHLTYEPADGETRDVVKLSISYDDEDQRFGRAVRPLGSALLNDDGSISSIQLKKRGDYIYVRRLDDVAQAAGLRTLVSFE